MEVTFTVPKAEEVMMKIKEDVEGVIVGAGTVLDENTCRAALKSGAEFIVSPHIDEGISKVCEEEGVLYVPGIMTPTEVVRSMRMNRIILKVFPGSTLSPSHVKALKGPFPNVEFIPTGGVNLENICEWFEVGCIAVGIGTSLTKGSIDEVEEKAQKFIEKIRGC